MVLLLLAFLAGGLTILSPCILPVLPFVFSRAGQPFLRSGLPLLAGMAISFTAVALLAVLGGSWALRANLLGRTAALVLLGCFGLALVAPRFAERFCQPLVRLGGRLALRQERRDGSGTGPAASVVLGVATGLLWAPCAGPILGLVLTGAALQGATPQTVLLLLAYALGAVTSLALVLLVGGRLALALKGAVPAAVWWRRGLGGAVLLSVGAIALGLDQASLARFALADTNALEKTLLRHGPTRPPGGSAVIAASNLPVLGTLPPFPKGAVWLHSPPLSRDQLWGKVVLIDIWTYSCINCVRTLPHVRAWAQKYRNHGLVVIGVHSPEFAFERDLANVRKASGRLGVTFPVVIDNDFTIWKAFNNTYWPAFYFIDHQGRIRASHFGEGSYAKSEQTIQQLLREAGFRNVPTGLVRP
ncbi:cytochrome c biogenesis protein DipZ [Synechococcus sp. CS-1325]|uniref:cytochrome c biogenesis protein DipZ n=1 Tax=Synechococcus sp. CS-1325 TaxID=2847979 RepID=UPI000DB68C52|nr:cytochrome c biogenesis protein DipZ [Synechococcus sp. CS-1325]MCT0199414.1 cytochrome c biogenesis protein DipZ [Synechococcus sp. CS-1325]PZV03024.1 MAG: cytochrome C biogenesis protein [Cyanobium sp.]